MDLGKAAGRVDSAAIAVNASGAVIVLDNSRTGYRTFLWNPGAERPEDGTVVEVDLPNPGAFFPLALNDFGQILFHRRSRSPIDGGLVLWTPAAPNGAKGELAPLRPPLAGARGSTEGILSNRGDAYSEYFDPQKDRWVHVGWRAEKPNEAPTQIVMPEDHPSGRPLGTPAAVNDRGWVVTNGGTPNGGPNLWHPDPADPRKGALVRVSPPNVTGDLFLAGINRAGQVVAEEGVSKLIIFRVDEQFHSGAARTIERLAEPPRGDLEPVALNNRGVLVGSIEGSGTGFRWTAEAGTQNLASLVKALPADWKLHVNAINDDGWIVGTAIVGTKPVGGAFGPPRRAFLLIPVTQDE